MRKSNVLDALLRSNDGYIKTSDAVRAGVSRACFGEYVRTRGLDRVAQGLYRAGDAWDDGRYVIQTRYPEAVFSHETAAYLLGLAGREPGQYSVTLKSGANATRLTKDGVKVYKVRPELFGEGIIPVKSPVGRELRAYNAERTICDLVRSRSNIEIQCFQTAIREYIRLKEKNIPLLIRYARYFSVEKRIRQYLEVLLP